MELRTDRYRPDGPPYLLYAFLGVSLVVNLTLVWSVMRGDDAPEASALAAEATVAAEGGEAVVGGIQPTAVVGMNESTAGAAGFNVVQSNVVHSLARTFQEAVGEDGDAVAAVYSRLFVWDLDLRRDLQKGDEVRTVWRRTETAEIELPVAWFKSSKAGVTLKAYRFKAPGDAYPSYWYPDGTEVPHRLVNGPIEDYIQITALLKDRPTHKGMDFKTEVGAPVMTPKPGTVTRVNWNWTANGNCVEVRYADGVLAKFLHLDKVNVKEGQHVAAGEVIAAAGNTGRSTAPHLHYQIERGDKVLDPIEYHGTVRRKLDPKALEQLNREIARLDSMLGTQVSSL